MPAEGETRGFRNPILPGFHPDPSICRVGSDHYLVTSSFEWFPGLPIFHSRDLVHWRPLGHVLDRPAQLALDGIRPSGGLYAPTIRHTRGTFYVICTLVDGPARSGHFVVTATDPAGPWSDPHWLDGEGFDPSLLFDDDGRAWFTASRLTGRYEGHAEVWLREFDPGNLKLVGDEHVIWDGAAKGAVWSEGPHLYRVDGRYYLLTSEGGTEHDHAVTVARADRIAGPYEGAARNPILTHRHLGLDHPIVGTGHADLVVTGTGEWWMVLLAMRPSGGYFYNLGRETFLTPVRWEDGWPVAGPVEDVHPAPELPACRWPAEPACDHFDAPSLAPYWNVLRTPREPFWSLAERPGHLRLRLRPESLTDLASPSLVARRQQHLRFAAHAALDFTPRGDGECAGLALVQNHDFHILLVVTARGLRLVWRADGVDTVLAEEPIAPGRVHLAVEAHEQEYQMRYATEPGRWRRLGGPVDGRILSSPVAGGFTGAYVGMYASANGAQSTNVADFDWFEYTGLPDERS
ncbi:glycoside hydrolase family 43 protein [Actinomadura sp. HBU206391]|uniref:glycoside hydrolase family 43 protein n=1 Tax=Actinomadura sp. HBU206391 TaxID=2731692 RepID=UPI00164F770D|nr:glycoside hydrolase family 43 protein [Actinomadura sp. HBU206391]MBC6458195.1 glycoside hydrolase family 43 protein [Actinomadura sp. HBU206391]